MEERKPYIKIWQKLAGEKSMIMLVGPRQAGKTTLSLSIAGSFTNSLYFNWGIFEQGTRFMEDPLFFESVMRKDPSTLSSFLIPRPESNL